MNYFQLPHSVNKGLPLLHSTGIVAKAQTAIVQLDCANDKLLVSTMTKCAVVDLKRCVSVQYVIVSPPLRSHALLSCDIRSWVESISIKGNQQVQGLI